MQRLELGETRSHPPPPPRRGQSGRRPQRSHC